MLLTQLFGFNRIPNDPNLAVQWKQAVGLDQNNNSNGLICINHFSPNDFHALIPSKRSKPNPLKGAFPSIFPFSNYDEVVDTTETVEIIQSAGEAVGANGFEVSNSSDGEKFSKCDNAQKQIMLVKIERDLEVAKLQDKVKGLQLKLTERTEQSQLLKKEVRELTKGMERSQKNLEEANALHKKGLDLLKVVSFLIMIY